MEEEYKIEQPYKVYAHINKINGFMYIGVTKQNINSRWRLDGSGYRLNPCFKNAIDEFGWDNFEHKILKDNLDEKTAKQLEKYYIKKYETRQFQKGYNMTDGGDGSVNAIISEETRKKISIAGSGKKRSEETKLKQSIARIGKKPTKKTLIKLSESHKGKKLSSYAKKVALDTLKKCSENRKRKIIGVSNDGFTIKFDSIKDASNILKCKSMIKNFKRIVENQSIVCGYKWNYVEE